MIQERLERGSDAIKRSTLEFDTWHGLYRVRYKRSDGIVFLRKFKDRDAAQVIFDAWAIDLKARAIQEAERAGNYHSAGS